MKALHKFLPWICCVLALVYAGQHVLAPTHIKSDFDLDTFRQLPVSAKGRTKPLDTVARSSLMSISGRQSLRTDDGTMSAIEWYIELVTKPEDSIDRPVFRIDHPDVLAMAGLDKEKRTRFSFTDIRPAFDEINRQASMASQVKPKARDPFQRAVLVLSQRLMLFSDLSQLQTPYLVPPMSTDTKWRGFVTALQVNPNDPDALPLLGLLQSYRSGEAEVFNQGVMRYSALLDQELGYTTRKAKYEVVFNQAQPFISASALYLVAFLLGCFGLLMSQQPKSAWPKTLFGSMNAVILIAFLVHTIGIASRIYLQGRPPVTNLYSSAVFIGWFSVLIGFMIDRKMKLGLGGIMASVIGFGTLIVAHNLGSSRDTMEMMQAVLDSNFWLATHVVVVTIGYSATFFAGFLAIAYLLLGLFTPLLDHERAKSLIKMLYGVICFATVTSFVGTVLGGIWADQSWGRFWGWDAKENGAVLIVLMNLLILHARWGGMIRDRGLVILAILGNIITSWSWFGTNMLGVGLHSYGFTQSAVFWLMIFVLSQLSLMSMAMVPVRYWRSKFAKPKREVA